MLRKSLVSVVVLYLSFGAGRAAAQTVPFSDTLMFVDWWVQTEPVYMNTVGSALKELTAYVEANEPGTQIYLIYKTKVPSQPPAGANQIRFVESYKDNESFEHHLHDFGQYVGNRYGGLFVAAPNSPLNPFVQVENAARYRPNPMSPPAGYIRPGGPEKATITQNVRWWLKPTADRAKILQSLAEFAAWCERNEPGTLIYLFSLPEAEKVWPPGNPGEIAFMAAYASEADFNAHVTAWNERFLSQYTNDFVSSPDGKFPFIQVLDLELFDGFVRPEVTKGGGAR